MILEKYHGIKISGMKIMGEEMYRELFLAIQTLPEICQQIFVLRLEGKSKQMIAQELGITVDIVNSQLKQGRKALRKQLSSLMALAVLHGLEYSE